MLVGLYRAPALNRAEGGVLHDEDGPRLGPEWAAGLAAVNKRLKAVAEALDKAVP